MSAKKELRRKKSRRRVRIMYGCSICVVMGGVTALITAFMLAVLAGGWLSGVEQDTGWELVGHSGPSQSLLLWLAVLFSLIFVFVFLFKNRAFIKALQHLEDNPEAQSEDKKSVDSETGNKSDTD